MHKRNLWLVSTMYITPTLTCIFEYNQSTSQFQVPVSIHERPPHPLELRKGLGICIFITILLWLWFRQTRTAIWESEDNTESHNAKDVFIKWIIKWTRCRRRENENESPCLETWKKNDSMGKPDRGHIGRWGHFVTGGCGWWCRTGHMECAPELASPNFPGEALCFEEPAFHHAFYIHPAVTILLQAAPLPEAFLCLIALRFFLRV